MSREILRQLKEQRANTDFGAVSLVDRESQKQRVMRAIGVSQETTKVSPLDPVWRTVEQIRIAFVSLPAATVTAMLVLVFGGSVGMVGAANSLPGDTLYSVKVATEKARLRIASQERKVLLRTEFAQNRLEEAAKLAENPDRVAQAMAGYEIQVKEAKRELESFKQAEPEAAARVAAEFDTKLDELSTLVNGQVQKENPSKAVDQAIESTKDVSKTVVEVIVDAKDKEVESGVEGQVINDSIRETYRRRSNASFSRQNVNLQRIAIIEAWYVERDLSLPTTLAGIRKQVEDVSDPLFESAALIARGGYRTAFELVDQVELDLISIEAQIAAEEIEVINRQNQEVKEEEEASKTEDNYEEETTEGDIISPDEE